MTKEKKVEKTHKLQYWPRNSIYLFGEIRYLLINYKIVETREDLEIVFYIVLDVVVNWSISFCLSLVRRYAWLANAPNGQNALKSLDGLHTDLQCQMYVRCASFLCGMALPETSTQMYVVWWRGKQMTMACVAWNGQRTLRTTIETTETKWKRKSAL